MEKKCRNCYDILRKMEEQNKGIMTAEIYLKFEKKYGSKRSKVKKKLNF